MSSFNLGTFNKSLSNSVAHEIMLECNRICLENGASEPATACVKNCTSKQSQLLRNFSNIIQNEVPRLQELSRF